MPAVEGARPEEGAQRPSRRVETGLVEVRGRFGLDVSVGLIALVLAAAFWVRSNTWFDAVAGTVLLVLSAVHLAVAASARTPVLVADEQGVRLRVGGAWRGLPWPEIRQVVVETRGSLPGGALLAEDRLRIVTRDRDALGDLGLLGRAHLRWNRLWYGAELSLPSGLTTGGDGQALLAGLTLLAGATTEVVRLQGGSRRSRPELTRARPEGGTAAAGSLPEPAPEPVEGGSGPATVHEPAAYDPVPAVRAVRRPMRAEVRIVSSADGAMPEQRSAPDPVSAFDVLPASEPARVADPVIGPRLVAARERLGLSLDDLSERTRIRPHVIEAMEADDFAPCGGDFYARGHLTALAGTLGLGAEELVADYDARYSHGPIDARRVFEAELAAGLGGGLRAAGGGPRWMLMTASVASLAVVWGLAHMLGGSPDEQLAVPPAATETAGLAGNRQPITSPRMTTTPMTVTAAHAPAHVVVRDRTGKILWSGDLEIGEHRRVTGLAPFKVEADNAGAVEVTVRGTARGTVGAVGEPGAKKFRRR